MHDDPFIHLRSNGTPMLCVPPGSEGFVVHEGWRLRLLAGAHRLAYRGVVAMFLVRVDATHFLELVSLGGAMLRDAGGGWRPIRLLGRLVYSVRRPELLVDLLEREQICEARQLERELHGMVVAQLANVFEGEPLRAERLSENLDVVGGEVQRRLTVALQPCGIGVQGLDLLAEPAPSAGIAARAGGV